MLLLLQLKLERENNNIQKKEKKSSRLSFADASSHLCIRTADSFQTSVFRFQKSFLFSDVSIEFCFSFYCSLKKINKCIDYEINDTIFARFEVIMTYCT